MHDNFHIDFLIILRESEWQLLKKMKKGQKVQKKKKERQK